MTDAEKPHDHDEATHEPPAADQPPAAAEESHGAREAAHDVSVHAEDGHEAPHPLGDERSTDAAHVELESDESVERDPEPVPVAPGEPVTAAALAGASTSTATRVDAHSPIWSDKGDVPDHSQPVPVAHKEKKKSGGSGNEFVEILKTVVFALLIAVILRVLLFQPFTIPSASMEPNLYHGDYIVVSKWSYGYSKHSLPFSPPLFEGRIMGKAPERGDVAVFKLPSDDKTDYIKRVIGIPGDRVQMIDGTLHINGQPVRDVVVSNEAVSDAFGSRPATQLTETLPNGRTFTIQDFGPGGMLDSTGVFEVPEGHYFMMGDNRDNSVDSRDLSSQGVGLVPEENLIGKAEMILFSWSPGASLLNPISWFTKVRPSRFFTVLD